jgi:hypothetical protein
VQLQGFEGVRRAARREAARRRPALHRALVRQHESDEEAGALVVVVVGVMDMVERVFVLDAVLRSTPEHNACTSRCSSADDRAAAAGRAPTR